MLVCRLTRERELRIAIAVERLPESCRSYLVGPDATKSLAGIKGVSSVRLERQYIDKAELSFEQSDASRDFAGIDQTLLSVGIRRVR